MPPSLHEAIDLQRQLARLTDEVAANLEAFERAKRETVVPPLLSVSCRRAWRDLRRSRRALEQLVQVALAS